MQKNFFLLVLISSLDVLACKVERARSETHFTLDPQFKTIRLESKSNMAEFEVVGCDGKIPFLQIGSTTVYNHGDSSRRETLLGDADLTKNVCSVEVAQELKDTALRTPQITAENLSKQILSRRQFLEKCVAYEISDFAGRVLDIKSVGNCTVEHSIGSRGPDDHIYTLSGSQCVIRSVPRMNLKVKTYVKSDCLGESLGQMLSRGKEVVAQDIESMVNVWPAESVVEEGAEKFVIGPVIASRPIRYTILPNPSLQARIQVGHEEYQGQRSFITALATDLDFARLDIVNLGMERYGVQAAFFVKNNSNDYCNFDRSVCFNPSSYVVPIAANLELLETGDVGGTSIRKASIGRWVHALKVPAHFIGLLEAGPSNNLSVTPGASLVLTKKLTPLKKYTLTADFFEPRALMDNDVRLKQLFSGRISLPRLTSKLEDGAVPSLPSLGIDTDLKPMPAIQSNKLSEAGFEFFTDRPNMVRNWSHRFDLICNDAIHKCDRVSLSRPFIKIQFKFSVGSNGEIIAESVEKKSDLFGSYATLISQMMKKVCR